MLSRLYMFREWLAITFTSVVAPWMHTLQHVNRNKDFNSGVDSAIDSVNNALFVNKKFIADGYETRVVVIEELNILKEVLSNRKVTPASALDELNLEKYGLKP